MMIRCTSPSFSHKVEFPTFTIDIVIAMSIAAAVFQEYRRSVRTSRFLGLHLALGILIDSTKSRSYFVDRDTHTIAYISAMSAVVRLVLLVLDETPKSVDVVDGHLRQPAKREARSGFWGNTLLLWLNAILLLGFRTRLTPGDLDDLGPELSPQILHQRFKRLWLQAESNFKHSLALVCFRLLRGSLFAVVIPRLVYALCSLAQPFVLQRLLIAIQAEHVSKYTQDSLVQAFVILYFAVAASRASYQHMTSRIATQLRGMLAAQVLDKSLTLSDSEAMKSAAMTLITKDIPEIARGIQFLYEIVFNVFEVVLGMICLALFVRQACVVIFLPLIFSIAFGSYMGRRTARPLKNWSDKTRHRVSETSIVLSQLRIIKMLGLGPTVSVYMQRLRDAEIAASRAYLACRTAVFASQIFTPTITPVLVIAAAYFWDFMKTLSTAEVVPCVATVAVIQRPLHRIIFSASTIVTMFAGLDRVQKYFDLEEVVDKRILTEPTPAVAEKHPAEDTEQSPCPVIEFVDVTLLSRMGGSEVLRQAHFTLNRGSITAVLGPSGSGKTALLQSLVGNSNIADGFIYVEDGTIGYADQSPWIRDVSIRQNVVGSLLFDPDWYATILRVCLLVDDLSQLPGGDSYVAGTAGMNLSGGQRHRVSLARALYCKARIIVLDDIFSALDRKTAVSIIFQLCGEEGLLRKAGCTVVFATYLPESLEIADQLLLLDGSGGLILEQDFHEEWFRNSLTQALAKQTVTTALEQEDKEKAAIQRSRDFQTSIESRSVMGSAPRSKTTMSLYSFFIESAGRREFGWWVVLVFLVSLGETGPDIFIRYWVDLAPENMTYLAGYFGVSVFATLVTAAAHTMHFQVLAPRSSTGLHERLTHVVMSSTLAFFSCVDSGSMLNRYTQDMQSIMADLPLQGYKFFYMLFHILLQVGILGCGTTYMMSMLPYIVAVGAMVLYYYVQTSRQVRVIVVEAKAPLLTHFTETANGLRHIRALGLRSSNLDLGLTLLDASEKSAYVESSLNSWLGLAVDLLSCGVIGVLTLLTVKNKDTVSVPAVGLSYLVMITFGMTLEYFIGSWAGVDNAVNALARLKQFVEETPMEPEIPAIDLPQNWPQKGEVKLSNVTAKYRSSGQATLHGISLQVVAGNKVGITGRTGSGKSSLFLGLLGFLEYTGTIEIDGINISTIPRDVLRSRIITISQEYLDLGGTVRNNLVPLKLNQPDAGGPPTDAEIDDVLESVGLLHIIRGRHGLDQELSKAGLSHGQLQLLSIARAILRGKETQAKLVLMDEATSNVDLETDAKIQKVLRESFSGCTILMIAHRLETIEDADMFVELSHGRASIVGEKEDDSGSQTT